MKKFLLATFLSIVYQLAFSQTYFKPGFVVTLHEDTIKGEIDCNQLGNGAGRINILTNQNQNKNFGPSEIRFYQIYGVGAYQSYNGKISVDPLRPSDTNSGLLDTTTKDTIAFLKLIKKGPVLSVLYLEDKIKGRFFIEHTQTGYTYELVKHAYGDADNPNVINTYRNQLLAEAQNLNKLTDKVTQLINYCEYTQGDIIGITDKLNGDKQDLSTVGNVKSGRLFAGINVSTALLNFTDRQVVKSNISTKFNPGIAMGIDYLGNADVGRFFLRFELSLTRDAEDFKSYTSDQEFTRLKYSSLLGGISPKVFYNFYNSDAFKFYAGAGIEGLFSFNHMITYERGADGLVYEGYADNTLTPFVLSFPVQAGIILNKKVDISFKFQHNPYYPTIGMNANVFQLGVNYLF